MDYVSLSYVLAFVYLVNFFVLLYLYIEFKSIKGLRYWFVSSIIGVFAFLSIFLKPMIGDYTAFLNNALILSGLIIQIEGLIRFKELNVFNKRTPIIIILILFAIIISFLNAEDATRRYLFYDIFLSLLLILYSIIIVLNQRKRSWLYYLPSISGILLLSTHMIRWHLALNGVIKSYDGIHPIISYAYFSGIIFSIVWLITILLMIQREFIFILQHNSTHDSMTNLLNRRQFDIDLEHAHSKALDGRLYIVDINRFKHINDSFGHHIGDLTLNAVAFELSSMPSMNSYRIGGDEFALLSLDDTENKTNFLYKQLNKTYSINEYQVSLSVSIGTGIISKSKSYEELYRAADYEMYKHKVQIDQSKKDK